MSDLKQGISLLNEPSKTIGTMLVEFYEDMKALESDKYRAGKQATLVVMTINDFEKMGS